MRSLGLLLLFLSVPAVAAECDDGFADCRDDCSLEYGASIKVEMKKKFTRCMERCTRKHDTCLEREHAKGAGQLDEGALDDEPAPRRSRRSAADEDLDRGDEPGGTGSRSDGSGEDDRASSRVPGEDPASEVTPVRSNRTELREEPAWGTTDRSSRTELSEKPASGPTNRSSRTSLGQEPVSGTTDHSSRSSAPPGDGSGGAAGKAPPSGAASDTAPARDVEPEPAPRPRRERKEPPPRKEDDHDDLRFH